MYKLITLVFLVTFNLKIASGQNFIDSTSIWYEIETYGTGSSDFLYESIYTIEYDTIISGESYFAIKRTYNKYFNEHGSDEISIEEDLSEFKYIQELNNKIYQWNNEKILLYDFNVSIGDTINDDHAPFAYLIVESIDTQTIAGKERKVFDLGFGHKMYEGIGSHKGIFNGNNWLGDEQFSRLVCFTQNEFNSNFFDGHFYFPFGTDYEYPECLTTITKLKEIQSEKLQFKIKSITQQEIIFESYSYLINNHIKYSILNLKGEIIKNGFSSPIQQENYINIEYLNPGLYILTFTNSGYSKSIKFYKR